MIIPIYQRQGSSSHQIAGKVAERLGKSSTHTGTLDPMAAGVLVCLTGPDRFNKLKWSQQQKTYQFSIAVGVETDTWDLLGLLKKNAADDAELSQPTPAETKQQIEKALVRLTGQYLQQMPKFSAGRLDGKSYFDLAKDDTEFIPKSQSVQISNLEINNTYQVSSSQFITQTIAKISQVSGDFRQPEVISSWKRLSQQQKNKSLPIQIIAMTATVSHRTYIRSLVRDISQKTNLPLTTVSILRTANGPFQIKDCISLV
jgi:tRNA pseudouridine55 synthase